MKINIIGLKLNRKNILKLFSLTVCISFVVTGVSIFATIPGNNNHEEIPEPIRDSEFPECIVEGIGTYFELTNSTYLNITLTSSEPIHIRLEVIPRMVSFIIKPNNTATSTLLTFTGFEVNTKYYLYQDGYLVEEFKLEATGRFSYVQDISKDHHIYTQEEKSTVVIEADGSISGPSEWVSKIVRSGPPSRYIYTLVGDIEDQIVIRRDNIVLDGNGYALISPGGGYGVYLNDRNFITIKNLVITGFNFGFYLYSSSNNNNLTDNIATNNGIGFVLYFSSSNTLTGNTVIDNKGYGFELYSSSSNTLTANTATNNGWGFYLGSSLSNTLRGNTATNNGIGFVLYFSSNNTLMGNTATNNINSGFFLISSSSNTITGNTATDNSCGFELRYSSNNSLTDNTAINNINSGFFLISSSSNTLTDNVANSNTDNGLVMYYSHYNLIYHNIIAFNQMGIELDSSASNLIFHNKIYENIFQASDTSPSLNDWHHPDLLEGNYWSDYPGFDNGIGSGKHAIAGDGIGDTIIPWPNFGYDFYPFMEIDLMDPPFTRLCVFGDVGNEGWFISDVLVILTATYSSETTTIYSLDNVMWYLYTDPFFIRDEGITTLYYRSIGNCRIEEIRSEVIKIDKTPPESEISLEGYLVNNEYYVTDVEVTLTAVDATSGVHHIEYYYGDSEWTTYTEPFTITEYGITTIYYRAVDVAGNVEDINSKIVNIDKSQCLLWFNHMITDKLELEDLCIKVYGNLEIAETGELHLINCTVWINNGTNPTEYGINVYGGLYISEGTRFTAMDNSIPYYFIVHEGSSFQMNDSRVEFCGQEMGGNDRWGLTIFADNCWIENNMFANCSIGLRIIGSEYNTVLNNILVNNSYAGFSIVYSDYTLIQGNFLENCGEYGLYLNSGWFNDIMGNTFIDNYYGVFFIGVYNSTFSNNVMINNTYLSMKIDSSKNCTFSHNYVTSQAFQGYYINYNVGGIFINNTAIMPEGSGFGMYYSDNNLFINNTIEAKSSGFICSRSNRNQLLGSNIATLGDGIDITDCRNNTVIDNILTYEGSSSSYGIFLSSGGGQSSHNTTLIGNRIENFRYGIYTTNSDGLTVINNTVVNINQEYPIGIQIFSSFSYIYGNGVENGYQGFYMRLYNCIFEKNHAIGHSLYGIRMSGSNNVITGNVIEGCNYGFSLYSMVNNEIVSNNIKNNEYGIYFDNPTGTSYNNIIYHNNFINNIVQAYDDIPESSYWYNPDTNEGNYWSDYTGVDTNGDGIGDTDLPWWYDPYPFINENGWI